MTEADVEIKVSRDQVATLEREKNELKREQIKRATLEREKNELKREQLERDEVSFTLFPYSSNGWSGRQNQVL